MSCLVFFLYMISLLCVCQCSDDFLSTYRDKRGLTSPLSIYDPVQRIRQQNAIARFNDLFAQDRLDAMDSLLRYSDDYENNERIIFAAITEAFSAAKMAFRQFKMKTRANLAKTHHGPDTLEEAVQDYINRNTDLVDTPGIVSDVIRSLNRNPRIFLPPDMTFAVIQPFIREAVKLAWQMSALAHPLDIAVATDAELFDESKMEDIWKASGQLPAICFCLLGFISVPAASPSQWVARSSDVSGTASVSETEEGQVTVVTSHGAVSSVHKHGQERKIDKQIEVYSPEDWAIIEAELAASEITENSDTADHPLRHRGLSRERRFMSADRAHAWPKAIVPYDFNLPNNADGVYYRDEALAAMTKWHKYTCVRFVPWVKGETKQKYELTAEWHVTITKRKRCAAVQGNIRSDSGQYNSCCSRYSCVHELGHTLGLWHEHQSPWRGDFLKLDWSNVPASLSWTFRMREPSTLEVYQYDITSTMHYGGSAFRILYEDLRPIFSFSNQYYMYKDVSTYHDCKERYCSSFTQQCHNDGFVTLVDGQCSCLCPAGLDSSTGCATTIKQVPTSSSWPAGSYALLSPSEGCPGNVFSSGSWKHTGEGDNSKSSEFHLAGSFQADTFQYKFCVKDDELASADWEPGRYCILRLNGKCPDDFSSGFIQFDDAENTAGTASGKLPDGEFGEDTRLEFCCRDDGFTSTPLLHLPNTQPLVLLMNQEAGECQEIAGMQWTEEYMWFDSFPDKAQKNGTHPYVTSHTSFKIWFCHYVPVNMNCGGEITLTRSNRQVVVTSPNFPSHYGTNMECTWLIKAAESNGRVLLNFYAMKVTTRGDDCEDSLEVRYNLPGQPGVRYCGDGIGRTIRSLNNTVILTLRTDHHHVAEDIGFNLTASLFIPEEDECFDPATKGRLYRGQKDYTRSMKPCLNWTEVTYCAQHAFNPSDFGSGLDKNYCRNPDNTAMPWCYTDRECNRDYCDVCNVERVFDRSAFCTEKVCRQTRENIIAVGCALTCNLQPPSAPIRNATCGNPGVLPDADFLQNQSQPTAYETTHAVGDTVTYRCSTGHETLQRTCMSSGEWSPAGYVCGACDDGWALHRGACYKYFDELIDFSGAQTACQIHGANVSSMKDEVEQNFVASLRRQQWTMWIGATDTAEEGKFVWQDGTPVTWTNWDPDDTPNNYRNQDCVEVYASYSGNKWNDISCNTQHPFVCKYTLSARQTCIDRHTDCGSVLLDLPETCTTHLDFARLQCPYSCGLCQPDTTPPCKTDPSSIDVELVSPQDKVSVTRGSIVRYACRGDYVLTQGQLVLACGHDGHLIGQLPVCKDPETTVQDSNDVEMIARSKTTSAHYAYTSVGSNLGIRRHGVIKQWRFFSPQSGWSMFQVWRPDPAGGNFSFKLVGQNLIMTSGQGPETQDVDEADWIHVQPGDRIGLWEPSSHRGHVPYDYCDRDSHPKDFGVTWALDSRYFGDFSPLQAQEFSSDINCRQFSFKAVIFPVDTVPSHPDRVTSQVPLLERGSVGAAVNVYLADSNNSYVPADGVISEWQFYVKWSGSAAFQVWRRRSEYGVRRYEFIGQNKLNLHVDTPHRHTFRVPEGERIAVKAGDIIAVLYGSNKLGVPYSHCNGNDNPESDNVYWLEPLTPETAEQGKVYSFSYTSMLLCRIFSFRAVVVTEAV